MNAYRQDTRRSYASALHRIAYPNDKKAAYGLGISRRTANRYKHDGPPVVKEFVAYLEGLPSERQRELLDSLMLVPSDELWDLPASEIVARIRERLAQDKEREGHANAVDCNPAAPMKQRFLAARADYVDDAELARLYYVAWVRRIRPGEL